MCLFRIFIRLYPALSVPERTWRIVVWCRRKDVFCRTVYVRSLFCQEILMHTFSSDSKNTEKRKGELQIMSDKIIENNQVTVIGMVVSEFTYSHEVFGEGFYMVDILVRRLSSSNDRIPVMVSERLLDVSQSYMKKCIRVTGQFRSYNRHEEQRNRLVLSVFAREIEFIDEEPDGARTNHILLEGYMCKRPVYRKTPLGREIADLLLAVNRPYGKSDYIPCICWGRNARYAAGFDVGEHVRILGRIQSREYVKKLSETETETRTAYEISVSKLECMDD